MKHSHLQSILTAAIVDYCQNNDLYLAELHIQGTVCISSDGAPTLVTQLSEKVSTTNNNRWIAAQQRVSPDRHHERHEDHRLEDEELALSRYEHPGSKSPSRKHRRKSDPGYRGHARYSSDLHRDVQNFRWSVDSIPETVSSRYSSTALTEEQHRDPASPERRPPYHPSDLRGQSSYLYKTPKEEPLEPGHKLSAHHSEVHDIVSTTKAQPHGSVLTEGRPSHSSVAGEEGEDGRREAGVPDLWRRQRDQAVSASALAIYNYMHSPTYHSADLRSAGISGQGQSVQGGPGKETLEEEHGAGRQQQQQGPGSSGVLLESPSTTVSGNPRSSPLPASPHEARSTAAESHAQSAALLHLRSPSAAYAPFRPSRDLPLSLPLDYTQHCGGLTSPVKAEAREELHVVTRSLGPHVPSMVSPSAQAAASAMAALSSLQASIMPSCPPPPTSKTSPASTVGTSASTSSGHSQERESPALEEVEPEPSPSPESPVSEAGGADIAGMTAAGCLQIPDAPVNSHFRKMMLKSLQGKYKVLKTAEGRYKCPVCGVSYVYQPNLRKHLEKVHLGKSYKCEFCGQKFTSVQGYSFHRKVKHRDLMPYRCELCRDAFYSYTAFLQHKKRSHSNHPECIAITHNQNLNLQKERKLSEHEEN